MTFLAGAVSLNPRGRVPQELERALVTHTVLPRRGPPPLVFRRAGAVIVKADLGAFETHGHQEGADGSLSLVCGEPLMDGGTGRRCDDVARLHHAWSGGNTEVLREASGTWSGVHFSPREPVLTLVADHLAVRPLYWAVVDDLVLFSSRLHVLPELPDVSFSLDEQGALEIARFDYCIGGRTPYRGIVRMEPGEISRISRDGAIRRERYWRWEEASTSDPEMDPAVPERSRRRFRRAVRRRLRTDTSVLAFLSGGLDSRCIVGELADLGMTLRTFNFSPPGSQDHLFAGRFARAVGAAHTFVPRVRRFRPFDGDWSRMLDETRVRALEGDGAPPDRPDTVWAGEGGSVGVGGAAALTDRIARAMRSGDIETAASHYVGHVPEPLLAGSHQGTGRDRLVAAVAEAISTIDHPDPLRRFFLFLLFNDQRRHLDGHFETMGDHGLEFQVPFFDRGLMEALAQVPVARLRKHHFYHEWLEHFPPVVRSHPWQTYPGHLPCPVPTTVDARDQWNPDGDPWARKGRWIERNIRRRRWRKMVRSRAFPSDLLSRSRLLAVGALEHTRTADYGYVVDFAWHVFEHAARTRS